MKDPTKSKYRYLAFVNNDGYRRYIKAEGKLEHGSLTHFDADIPAHGSYGALLFDPRWKTRREQILIRDQKSCLVCRSSNDLQVHHRQYHFIVRENKFRLPWEYSDHLLITLCESCHKRGHSKFTVPTINI